MDEDLAETAVPRVGERLRVAREAKGLSLEDVAAQTRIPQRHLESLESSEWEKLPAPTYTVGFAKNYAGAVDLDRAEIGEALREEMGGQRFMTAPEPEVFEPADPARTMPKWLVLGAILGVILIVALMSWLNHRSLEQHDDATANQVATVPPSAQPAPSAPRPAAAQGPVVLTATGQAWVRVTDQGKKLYEATMQPGQTYQVPQTAIDPIVRVGAPEALRINVGSAVAPMVGPAGRVADASLKPADLMRGPQSPQASASAPPTASAGPSPPPPPAANSTGR